jgi:hypothetical protein
MTNLGFWNYDQILWIHNKNITEQEKELLRVFSLLK